MKILTKILLRTKWAILARLWRKILKAYISRSTLRILSKLSSKREIKIIQVEFPKKSSFGSNGQFWPDCGPKLCKLISQDALSGGGAGKKSIKITFLKFSKKSSFGPNLHKLTQLWPQLTQTYISGFTLRIFF